MYHSQTVDDVMTCTRRVCDATRADIDELELSRRTRSTNVLRITDEQAEVLAKTEPEEDMPLSERILIESAAERSRVSQLREVVEDKLDPDYPKHQNQCQYCPKSFKKPRYRPTRF